MKLHILTAVTRPENLALLADSLVDALHCGFQVCWHIIEDVERTAVGGQALKNRMLDASSDGWVWVLDDDNLAHPQFFGALAELLAIHPEAGAFVVSQQLAGGSVRHAEAAAMQVNGVDIAQVVFKRNLIGDARLDLSYGGDGLLIEQLYRDNPAYFVFVSEVLCYYNRLR